MTSIGTVAKTKNGNFEGRLVTLSINVPIVILPVIKMTETSPSYRITANGADVGAGWIKDNKTDGGKYISLTFDAPELPKKIYANLGQAAGQDDEDVFSIIWNRPNN